LIVTDHAERLHASLKVSHRAHPITVDDQTDSLPPADL
jgi:hypothetical protein